MSIIDWWDKRIENEHAWKVPIANIIKFDPKGNMVSVDLDLKNPRRKKDLDQLPPTELTESIINKERQISVLLEEIKSLLAKRI